MSYLPYIAGGAALGLAARGRRASRKFDYRDYVDLTAKKISLKEFLQRNPEIKLADPQRLSAFPGSGLSKGYSYDCFVHAELRAVELSGAPSFRQVDWEGVGISGAGSDPRKGTDIPWNQAKKGDWVRWAGLGGHYGVVIDPKLKIVESCWGYQGAVFQHPVDFHPYPGTPKVYPIRLKSGRRASAPLDAFMEGYRKVTQINPMWPQTRYWQGKGIPIIITEVHPIIVRDERIVQNRVILHNIISPETRGEGGAGAVLDYLTSLADKHGVEIRLSAVPFSTGGTGRKPLTKKQLIRWYKRHGFEDRFPGEPLSRDELIRYPRLDLVS